MKLHFSKGTDCRPSFGHSLYSGSNEKNKLRQVLRSLLISASLAGNYSQSALAPAEDNFRNPSLENIGSNDVQRHITYH